MLYCVMRRTQLYLDEDQYRWLKQQAGARGSIARVVRGLVDSARSLIPNPAGDPLIRYLFDEPPGKGKRPSDAATIDQDLYGR